MLSGHTAPSSRSGRLPGRQGLCAHPGERPGPGITLRSEVGPTPVSPAQPSVSVRLYDALVPAMKLEPKQRQMVAKPSSHTGLCPSDSGRTHLASETPGHQELCLPKALPWLMTGPESHTGSYSWSVPLHTLWATQPLGCALPFPSQPPPSRALTALPCPASPTRGSPRRAAGFGKH